MHAILPITAFCTAVAFHGFSGVIFGSAVVRFFAVAAPIGIFLLIYVGSELGVSSGLFATMVTYAFLCELYLFLFTLCMASVSANLVMFIAGGERDTSLLAEKYDSTDMVQLRIERLESANLVYREGDIISLTSRARFLVEAYRWLRATFGHRDS
jgi:hypothetical protein